MVIHYNIIDSLEKPKRELHFTPSFIDAQKELFFFFTDTNIPNSIQSGEGSTMIFVEIIL
jgi:hypothetical protein